MELNNKIVVVTGSGDGIGRGLCERFAANGARVVVTDMNEEAALRTAAQLGTIGLRCDVANAAEIEAVIEKVERDIGPIDLFCSNAGIAMRGCKADKATDDQWSRAWNVNVMAHVHAARLLLPRMIARGGGYFLQTVSAAGLLTRVDDAIYSTTKHAAVGFAENLWVSYRDEGIRVSILCPQSVDTAMLHDTGNPTDSHGGVLTIAQVGDIVVEALRNEIFCILPHEEVRDFMQRKTNDYDRWLAGMAKYRRLSVQSGVHAG